MSFKSLILCSALLMPMTFARADFASAHAYPVNVSPADGSTIAQPPREVRVQFTEGIELEFSRSIDIKNAGGEKVTAGTFQRLPMIAWPSISTRHCAQAATSSSGKFYR